MFGVFDCRCTVLYNDYEFTKKKFATSDVKLANNLPEIKNTELDLIRLFHTSCRCELVSHCYVWCR